MMASMLTKILTFFSMGTSGFNDYELAILNAISDQLSEELQERLHRRINSVNLVQRLDGGREVNAYAMEKRHPMKKRRPILDDATRLNSSAEESILATFQITGSVGTANSGKAWLVNGFFFSLEFDEPTEHARKENISEIIIALGPSLESLEHQQD